MLIGAGPYEVEFQVRVAVVVLARRREIPAVDVISAQIGDAGEDCVEGSQGVEVNDEGGAFDDEDSGEGVNGTENGDAPVVLVWSVSC